jgi:ABC-type cobalamin/Fe3+-siderophores transport system ATPase subunit
MCCSDSSGRSTEAADQQEAKAAPELQIDRRNERRATECRAERQRVGIRRVLARASPCVRRAARSMADCVPKIV